MFVSIGTNAEHLARDLFVVITICKTGTGEKLRHLANFVRRCAAVFINQLAISGNDTVNVFGGFHSAFDFKRSDARIHKRGNVSGKAKIFER